MSETVDIIEEYRAKAVAATLRAMRAENTLAALLRYTLQDNETSLIIPNKIITTIDQWTLRGEELKSGLKLEIAPRKEDPDAQ